MTVAAKNPSISYLEDGITTAFPVPWRYLAASSLLVRRITGGVATTLVLGADYAATSGVTDAGGTLSLTLTTAGSTLLITRATPRGQTDAYNTNDSFPAKTLEGGLDRAMLVDQEQDVAIADLGARAIRVPVGETAGDLPAPADRAGKYWFAEVGTGKLVFVAGAGAAATEATMVQADDGEAGAIFGSVQGFIDALLAATALGRLLKWVSLAEMDNLIPVSGMAIYATDAGKEGEWKWFPGNPPVSSDLWGGLYRKSNVTGYWARVWDGENARPEWWGFAYEDASAAAANDVKLAACYASAIKTRLRPGTAVISTTLKCNIEHHSIHGAGEKYTDGDQAGSTRILLTNGVDLICQHGPDTFPGSVNALPQRIEITDIDFGRTVAPVINSNCVGVRSQWVLYGRLENVRVSDCMVAVEAYGTAHTFHTNVEGVRANAGTGAGADYFVNHYVNGAGDLAAGGNASLRVSRCIGGCNYGPLQTVDGSVGFKADQAFTDLWYTDCETTNFHTAQAVFGNNAVGIAFSNTDLKIEGAKHDQFHNSGIYIQQVASSGSAEIISPYLGPSPDARAAYWVNNSLGAVVLTGGQFVMGAAPGTQPLLFTQVRGASVTVPPIVLEAGNAYPVIGLADVSDGSFTVIAKNPYVTAGAVVQISGNCDNVYVAPISSGKAAAFDYGIQVLAGATLTNCTFDVSRIASSTLAAANRKLNYTGTPVTAAGPIAGATSNLAQGNFN